MRTIIAATDFSQASSNAIDYAVEMAKHTGAKLELLYVAHTPPVSIELPVVFPSSAETEKDGLAQLAKIRRSIVQGSGRDIEIECVCLSGFAVDQLYDYANAHNPDLVVMGMQGVGYLSETFIGSITTSLIRKADFPVLVINQKVRFRIPRKIVFASDDKHIKATGLEPLNELAELFNAHIYSLHVCSAADMADIQLQAEAGVVQATDLAGLRHSLHFATGDSVAEGITGFVARTDMHMLVMIPGKHSFFETILHGSETRKMAFHASVPLLVLPVRSNEQ